jgi:hypothetical protein
MLDLDSRAHGIRQSPRFSSLFLHFKINMRGEFWQKEIEDVSKAPGSLSLLP